MDVILSLQLFIKTNDGVLGMVKFKDNGEVHQQRLRHGKNVQHQRTFHNFSSAASSSLFLANFLIIK